MKEIYFKFVKNKEDREDFLSKDNLQTNSLDLDNTEIKSNLDISEKNKKFVESLANPISSFAHTTQNEVHEISGESKYVQVEENNKMRYGGNQSWWSLLKKPRSVNDLSPYGCGPMALADIIAYHISLDYNKYKGLLKFNHEDKKIEKLTGKGDLYYIDNPKFSDFNEEVAYNSSNKKFDYIDYIDFADFYANIAGMPQVPGGTSLSMMKTSKSELEKYSKFIFDFKVLEDNKEPIDQYKKFIDNSLDNNAPVMFQNSFESGKQDYMSKASSSVTFESIGSSIDFDNHWMVITKSFVNGSTKEERYAFATWGSRVSISSKLLQSDDGKSYYSDFVSLKITPK